MLSNLDLVLLKTSYKISLLTFVFWVCVIPPPWSCFQNILPFCMREVWVISACTDLINATASRYSEGLVAPDIEKEFYRLQGDLYSQCRTKVLVFFFTSDEVT